MVTKFLIEKEPDLKCNGRSDYPDLYLGSIDYSGLTSFRRGRKDEEVEYGAALKGKEKRPVRVPDGLEIKTCRDQIRVDCHSPHAGLHLALVFEEVERFFNVTDLCVGFLRLADYREAGRNTTATTVKYSFNGESFVSLFVWNRKNISIIIFIKRGRSSFFILPGVVWPYLLDLSGWPYARTV